MDSINPVSMFCIIQAGMQAVRENRYVILTKDFEKAYKKAIRKEDTEHDFYKWRVMQEMW